MVYIGVVRKTTTKVCHKAVPATRRRRDRVGRCNFTFRRGCQSVQVVICVGYTKWSVCVGVICSVEGGMDILSAQVRGLHHCVHVKNNFNGIFSITNVRRATSTSSHQAELSINPHSRLKNSWCYGEKYYADCSVICMNITQFRRVRCRSVWHRWEWESLTTADQFPYECEVIRDQKYLFIALVAWCNAHETGWHPLRRIPCVYYYSVERENLARIT